MSGPEFAGEAGRAGLYAIIGGAALKIAEALLRRADRRHKETLDDVDATIRAGADLREELRKENEEFRARSSAHTVTIARLEIEVLTLQKQLAQEQVARQDAEAEVRLLKRAQRTPVPPSRPPEEGRP